MSQHNPVALITGASQRIGAGIANSLHQQGYNIVIHYNNSSEQANALAEQLNAQREDSAICIQADLCQQTSIETLAEQAIAKWQRIDALVNNASSFYPTPIGKATLEDWDALISSNAKAPFFLSQALAKTLADSSGCIVNIVDVHSERPMKQHSIYCMAKAALAMMTKTLAKELAPKVRVNGVSPGAILWPEQEPNEETKQMILAKVPLATTGKTEDITNAVRFLICHAPYITEIGRASCRERVYAPV